MGARHRQNRGVDQSKTGKGTSVSDCPKCYRPLHRCQSCDGKGSISDFGNKVNCGKCNNTGQVCSQHGGLWK